MATPLALLETEHGWVTAQNSVNARGIKATKIVFVREPKDEELKIIFTCLPVDKRNYDNVYTLDDLIENYRPSPIPVGHVSVKVTI
jgi:hypothetical protein